MQSLRKMKNKQNNYHRCTKKDMVPHRKFYHQIQILQSEKIVLTERALKINSYPMGKKRQPLMWYNFKNTVLYLIQNINQFDLYIKHFSGRNLARILTLRALIVRIIF